MAWSTADRQKRQDEENFFNMIKRRSEQMNDAEVEWKRHYEEIYARADAGDRAEMEAVKLRYDNRTKATRGF